MTGTLVALDIETTGLNPRTDSIIEIGAVRFNEDGIDEEWTTLINPKRRIPKFITQLTGINDEMTRNAPTLEAILPELIEFVGDAPIVGHNVSFDLSFFISHGVFRNNPAVDTYELVSVLMPTASRYNLGALSQRLDIELTDAHRALNDARATYMLYEHLYKEALLLPVEIIEDLIRYGEPLGWQAGWVLKMVLEDLSRQPSLARHVARDWTVKVFNNIEDMIFQPLEPNEYLRSLDVDECAALLEYGGLFANYFGHYEHRPEQVDMLKAIAFALSESQHFLIEAGTGTGKSFAYLVPAALWAMQNNLRVVISTNTINLQEQLIQKDIPDLCAALDIDLRASVLKGRSNYLCPKQLETMRKRTPVNVEEVRVLAKVLVWLYKGGSGDRSEINLNGPIERDIWTRISARNDSCKAEVCMGRLGGQCPFYQAKLAAQSSHLLIVNHALLLSDIATGSRILPEYRYLIVDEAHHLEDATTNALSYRVTEGELVRILKELGGMSSGLLSHLLSILKSILKPTEYSTLVQSVRRSTDLIFRLEHDFHQFFLTIHQFLEDQRDGLPVGVYGQQERILSASRTQPAWAEVEVAWEQAEETSKLLNNLLSQVHKNVGDLDLAFYEDLEDAQDGFGNAIQRLSEACEKLTSFVFYPEDEQSIYWADISSNSGRLALNIAPLYIGELMERHIWHEKESVILTSATLTANGEFDYIRGRLNAVEADELMLGSPFDYETSALLYLVNDIAEPSDGNNYQRAVEQILMQLGKATGGKMLVLFTSYAQLKRTSQAISPTLLENDIQVYEQGDGASPNTLLETFRTSDRAVLLGTRAFWEGVDIPGEALSTLVVVKIPFDVPSDPIISARSETFEDPFNEYSLPEAILRFRQGFGRLIRTQTDRGIVVMLDKRILSKRYGKAFIESLPQCKLQVGSMHDLPEVATRWLNI